MAINGTPRPAPAVRDGTPSASTSPSHPASHPYLAALDPSSLPPGPRWHSSLDRPKPRGRVHRALSASNVLDRGDSLGRRLHDPDHLGPRLQHRAASRDGLTDLVDFLRNHAPPPDNFMSMPDATQDSERRKWLRWASKVTKRPKTASRPPPPPIHLPDTAVSGTTIGGHRHIAITIPFEAFPLGERPRSQYPVYSSIDARGSPLGSNSVRTVVNDKGVVTVLKTVNEHRVPPGSPSNRDTLHYSSSQSGSLPPSRSGRSSFNGFISTPPSRGSMSAVRHGDGGASWDVTRSRPSTRASASAFPPRSSSRAGHAMRQHVSIDGMLSQPFMAGGAPGPSCGDESRDGDWPLRKTGSVRSQPSPATANWPHSKEDGNISTESGATVLDENLLAPRNDGSGPPTPASSQNRRDRVRERKRRDMESLLWPRSPPDDVYAGGLEEFADLAMSRQIASRPTLSPIRVVLDVEPSPNPNEAASAPPSPVAPERDTMPAYRDHVLNGLPSMLNGPNHLTPPRSPDPSSPRRNSALDRTSLQRRREWNATREHERKMKEVMDSVHAQTQHLVSPGARESADVPQTLDKEILRLYEAYRDHRFRDMERRVRRLERNGDVWLRALVPVLDNLNQTMGSASREGIDDRAWMSDDEPAAASRRSTARTAVPIRRANSSRGVPHEVKKPGAVSERTEDVDVNGRRDSEGSDDVSGLDTIEPLMRELAGAAKLRQMRSEGRNGLLKAC